MLWRMLSYININVYKYIVKYKKHLEQESISVYKKAYIERAYGREGTIYDHD